MKRHGLQIRASAILVDATTLAQICNLCYLNTKSSYPVKEGLVFRPEEYIYISIVDYSGGEGLLNVLVIK